MHIPLTGLLALALALALLAACAPRQDHRSPAEIACAIQAEQVMADRNRGRNLRLETPVPGAQSIIEDTNVLARFDREAEYVELQRLTRECLQRAEAQPGQAAPREAPGWTRPPALLRW